MTAFLIVIAALAVVLVAPVFAVTGGIIARNDRSMLREWRERRRAN